jgi:D-alanyl-D-alanine carboxypeptidase
MSGVGSGVARGLRCTICGFVVIATVLAMGIDDADARGRRKRAARASSSYSPPYASIVVDANSGRTLQETNPDSLRHPASLTKIMTLYLLFERLDAGKLKLGSIMTTSGHAASQAPTKLGLKPGAGLKVEDAIRGLVTRSANDAAVVIAEAIGGDENTFAEMMTRKARALGMTKTVYRNASGLPDDEQVTTARDQAILGRAIQERFPRHYTYFATPSFSYNGSTIRNHNHLLGRVEGVDGIKTGYTNASGFNLVTSMRRDGKHLVAVVLGGRSAGARDAKMRELITTKLAEAATKHTAPMIAETSAPVEVARAAKPAPTFAVASSASVPAQTGTAQAAAPAHAAPSRPAQGGVDPIRPIAVKTIKVKLSSMRTASLAAPTLSAPQPASEDVIAAPSPAPTPVAVASAAPVPVARESAAPVVNPQPGVLGVLPAAAVDKNAMAAAVPRRAVAMPVTRDDDEAEGRTEAKPAAKPEAKTEIRAEPKAEARPEPARAQHSGWIIQVGAFPAEDEAKQRLSSARSKAKNLLERADAFTETVTKGTTTLYRARFAGLDKEQAEAACKHLKRNEMACLTIKN